MEVAITKLLPGLLVILEVATDHGWCLHTELTTGRLVSCEVAHLWHIQEFDLTVGEHPAIMSNPSNLKRAHAH